MRIGGKHYRSIWQEEQGSVRIIDQRMLPFRLEIKTLSTSGDVCMAISDMVVRGAPLIGVTAAYGLYLAGYHSSPGDWCNEVKAAAEKLIETRPTAVNLKYAVGLGMAELNCAGTREGMIERLFHLAAWLAEKEVSRCSSIGENGLALIRGIHERKGGTVQILTHCNAGWLACVDHGTATAPIYRAHDEGLPVHVWVDETRPRNQGARLTAFELGQHGVPHTVIVDNAGGHLMQSGQVDMVIVGSDRTTRNGDVANKIGTYLKALAARDNNIPFYVALPVSSIDMDMEAGKSTVIENRDGSEVSVVEGWNEELAQMTSVRIIPERTPVENPGFDITPARLVSGLITDLGICGANKKEIELLMKR
jgi:methylthioribose-1-phosphate isomerase